MFEFNMKKKELEKKDGRGSEFQLNQILLRFSSHILISYLHVKTVSDFIKLRIWSKRIRISDEMCFNYKIMNKLKEKCTYSLEVRMIYSF